MKTWKKGAILGFLITPSGFLFMAFFWFEPIFTPPEFVSIIFLLLPFYPGIFFGERFLGTPKERVNDTTIMISLLFWTLIGASIGFAIEKYNQRRET